MQKNFENAKAQMLTEEQLKTIIGGSPDPLASLSLNGITAPDNSAISTTISDTNKLF